MGVSVEFVVVISVKTACVKGGFSRPQVRDSKLPQPPPKGTTAAPRARAPVRGGAEIPQRFGIQS
jgi:hypothetical protein